MPETEPFHRRASKHLAEHLDRVRTNVPSPRLKEHLCKFGTVVRALWPTKPALHLSQLEGCSERGAQYQIDGERKPTAKAIHAVDGEMLGE